MSEISGVRFETIRHSKHGLGVRLVGTNGERITLKDCDFGPVGLGWRTDHNGLTFWPIPEEAIEVEPEESPEVNGGLLAEASPNRGRFVVPSDESDQNT